MDPPRAGSVITQRVQKIIISLSSRSAVLLPTEQVIFNDGQLLKSPRAPSFVTITREIYDLCTVLIDVRKSEE